MKLTSKPIKKKDEYIEAFRQVPRLEVVNSGYVLENLNNFNLYVIFKRIFMQDDLESATRYLSGKYELKPISEFTIRQLYEELFPDPDAIFVIIED